MDFSHTGGIERVRHCYRAHFHWRAAGAQRDSRGPRRPVYQAAEDDLRSMRAAASGMGCEGGFAAIEAFL